MTTYIKIESDTDEVSVTFVSGDVLNTTKMTREELVNFING